MNEDLSNVLEETLRYVSPLPVPLVNTSCKAAAPSTQEQQYQLLPLNSDVTNCLTNDNHVGGSNEYFEEQPPDLESSFLQGSIHNYSSQPSVSQQIIESDSNLVPTVIVVDQGSNDNLCALYGNNMPDVMCINEKPEVLQETTISEDMVCNSGTHETDLQPLNNVIPSQPTMASNSAIVQILGGILEQKSSEVQSDGHSVPAVEEPVAKETAEIDYDPPDSPPVKVKKKRRREKNPDPPPEAVLPPCKICNEKSSGYHYGANTCEACKGFFRRTLKKKEVDYKCKCKPEELEEWKRGPSRNGCPACRYERCLQVGMSKNAIKIGRYTIDHKTNNIKEVKTLELQEKVKEQLKSPQQTVVVDNVIEAFLAQVIAEASPEVDSGFESPSPSSSSQTAGEPVDLSLSRSECSPLNTTYVEPVNTSAFLEPASKKMFIDTAAPFYEKAGLTLKELDTLVKTLTAAHKAALCVEEIPLEQVKKRHKQYLEQHKLKQKVFGEMKTLTRAEFAEFYKTTGIDLDGRLKHADSALEFFEQKISLIVTFSKAIPGFRSLNVEDQANLIKASRLESTILGAYRQMCRNVNFEKKVLLTPWGKEYMFHEINNFFPLRFVEQRFRFAQKLMRLDLTLQEESLMRAIVVTFTDRCEVQDRSKIEAIQEKLVFCLQYLLDVRHGGRGNLLYRIFDLLTELRILTEEEQEFTNHLLNEPYLLNKLNSCALMREFLT